MIRECWIWGALYVLVGCASSSKPSQMIATDRPFDLAIDGQGYFIVETGLGGYLFTRKGDFVVDSQRYLATSDGYRLAPPIQLPENTQDLLVSPDGQITAIVSGSSEHQTVGKVVLACFNNPSALQREGDYYLPTSRSGDPIPHVPGSKGVGVIKFGFLERE